MEHLNIGFDAKRAVANNTGLGNYSRLVVDVLSDLYPMHNYMLYAPHTHNTERVRTLLSRPNVQLLGPDTNLWQHASAIWRVRNGITRQLARNGVQLFHGLSNELPLDIARSGIPSVVTIHDLIFRRCPEGYKAIDRQIYDYKFRHAALNASHVIAISECTKRDLIDLYHIPESKISVVYQGCNPVFTRPVSPERQAAVKKQFDLPDTFIAMVGTIEPRKNQLLAVRAMSYLTKDVSLVIIGRGRMGYDDLIRREIRRLNLEQRVKILPFVESCFLPAVYSLATIAAYPSRYEGFGIPVIEAINRGTPVIAATGSCLEEAGGPGALYVRPDFPNEFADAASRLLFDTQLRADMVRAGKEWVQRFSRSNFANGIMDVYQSVLG